MSTINNQNLFGNSCDPHYGDRASIRPITEATSKEARAEIAGYRRLGVLASELGIVRNFPGGPELVVVNKSGMMKLAKLSPLGGVEVAARIQSALTEAGHPLTIDEELDIASAGPVKEG